MFDYYLPRRDDHFPKTKRGHGTTHPQPRYNNDGIKLREACRCVDATCDLLQPKSKNHHHDKKANIQEWCDLHGVSTKHDTPAEAMVAATGGR